MSPAKATRPGFRQSISTMGDPRRVDQTAINLFHPIYHCFTYPIGCRVDIERLLPADLENEDREELIDSFSDPAVWIERFSPLAVQVGDQVIRGKNAADLMLKVYRQMFELFQGVGKFIETTMTQATGEPAHSPFMSLCVDPDIMHRLIEADYESGEATYANLMRLFAKGTISPCLTTPFHNLLPLLETDAEIRLCIRSSLIFYLRVIRLYAGFMESFHEDGLMVLPFWLPESCFSVRVLDILEEEFKAFCKKEKMNTGHLVLLLDNHQANYEENDVLMKSWNQIRTNGQHPGNGNHGSMRGGREQRTAGPSSAIHNVTVMFRDRSFSDWVIHANPSVKKLLDRTIAKVDSDINAQNVHYGWAHFEELEAMTYNPRAIVNFQQKLIKLTELGYLPLSPDFYVRGKLRGEFGCTRHEPQQVNVIDRSAGNGWEQYPCTSFSRWFGYHKDQGDPGNHNLVPRPYHKLGEEGKIQKPGHPCWKVAWEQVHRKCYGAVVGDLETLSGGMAEVLADLSGQSSREKARRNVQDFLANYTYIYWREHFIQHDVAEADINILELAGKHLQAGLKEEIGPVDAAKAGGAAQAIYFGLDSSRSFGTGWENMDQRAFYQNVVLLTLAICNAIHVYHWLDDSKSAKKLLALLKTELLDFEGAHERYNLAAYGISAAQWAECIQSEVQDSADNVVRRAALRIAARHLRPLGYTKDFTRQNANMTTNVGHLWSTESSRENFLYENPHFCGLHEA